MPLRKAARVFAALAILFGLYALVWQLPLLRWIVEGAKALHDLGWPGILATFAAIYLLSLLLVPIIPLVVACGWLFGPWGFLISLGAAVASAATAFSVARAVGRGAAAQAMLERPKARALADLAAQGGPCSVAPPPRPPPAPISRRRAACSRSPWCGSRRCCPTPRATR